MPDVLEQITSALQSNSDARRDEALDAAYVEIERLRKALNRIWEVGDGWGPNSDKKPAGTTGEGHHKCRWIAREALNANQ